MTPLVLCGLLMTLAGQTQVRTVSYGVGPAPNAKQAMDIYLPDRLPKGGAPVILFLHGGVWQLGDRRHYANVGEALAAHGYITAVASYRLSPQVTHPAHVEDAAAAVAWLHRNVAGLGGDPSRLILSGHSAGGHLVTLLLLEPRWLKAVDVDPANLAAVVPLSGIFDLTRPITSTGDGGLSQFVAPAFGKDRAVLWQASPMAHLHKSAVPLRVLVAGRDDGAMVDQSRVFVAAARKAGLDVSQHMVPGVGHFEMVTGMGASADPTVGVMLRVLRDIPRPSIHNH